MYRRILYINSDKHVAVIVISLFNTVVKTDLFCKSGICVEVVTSIAFDFQRHGGLVSQTLFLINYIVSNSCDLLMLAIIAFQT